MFAKKTAVNLVYKKLFRTVEALNLHEIPEPAALSKVYKPAQSVFWKTGSSWVVAGTLTLKGIRYLKLKGSFSISRN